MIRALAHAKVNLSLEVGPVGPDGYHPYVSHAISVGLFDVVTFDAAEVTEVVVDSGMTDTLVTCALEAAGRTYHVHVEKHIPAGAGLGGGSADAAAALVVAGRTDLAATIGTDVAFCCVGGHARLTGRGEVVETLRGLPATLAVLVVVPPVQVSTAAVFAAYDETGPGDAAPLGEPWLRALVPGCSFRNDLTAAALHVAPELVEHRSVIAVAADRDVLMTGSGAAFCAFAESAETLQPAAGSLRRAGYTVALTHPTTTGVTLSRRPGS